MRLLHLFHQPDFRAHPLRALWRRLLWHLHWAFRRRPPVLENWYGDLKIALPHSGCAAQVFYRKHSNRGIVEVMERYLRPGDIVLDVGAHIGEYTLVASKLVGPQGQVHAIEPQPHAAAIIAMNARLNGLENIKIHECALGDREGTMPFKWDSRSWGGLLVSGEKDGNLMVQCITLDQFCRREQLAYVRLVKIDAAGNERAVLQGGASLFCSAQPPVVLCKLYHPEVVRDRFGYEAREIVELLQSWGYALRVLTGSGELPVTPTDCYQVFSRRAYGFPLVGWRKL